MSLAAELLAMPLPEANATVVILADILMRRKLVITMLEPGFPAATPAQAPATHSSVVSAIAAQAAGTAMVRPLPLVPLDEVVFALLSSEESATAVPHAALPTSPTTVELPLNLEATLLALPELVSATPSSEVSVTEETHAALPMRVVLLPRPRSALVAPATPSSVESAIAELLADFLMRTLRRKGLSHNLWSVEDSILCVLGFVVGCSCVCDFGGMIGACGLKSTGMALKCFV